MLAEDLFSITELVRLAPLTSLVQHMCACFLACLRLCVYACLLASVRACVRACMCLCVCAFLRVCVRACVYAFLRAFLTACFCAFFVFLGFAYAFSCVVCVLACVRAFLRACVCVCIASRHRRLCLGAHGSHDENNIRNSKQVQYDPAFQDEKKKARGREARKAYVAKSTSQIVRIARTFLRRN